MSFAKISINEIQILHQKKVSGLEMLVYTVIASHIHSKHRNNAYPSLRRIQEVLGGNTKLQSIARAITNLVNKGLLEKGKIRSKSRFLLIHRPVVKRVQKLYENARDFVMRMKAENILKPVGEVKVKPVRLHKRSNQVEKSNNVYEKRGELVWGLIAPTSFTPDFDLRERSKEELEIFLEWVEEKDTENKVWIVENFASQMKNLKQKIEAYK